MIVSLLLYHIYLRAVEGPTVTEYRVSGADLDWVQVVEG